MERDRSLFRRRLLSPVLRDIRPDLIARLQEAASRHKEFQQKANDAAADVDALQRMIERENVRMAREQSASPEAPAAPAEALADFVLNQVSRRAMGKEALRVTAIAAGYNVDGRSIHAVTLGLLRGGKIIDKDGLFIAADSEVAQAH